MYLFPCFFAYAKILTRRNNYYTGCLYAWSNTILVIKISWLCYLFMRIFVQFRNKT